VFTGEGDALSLQIAQFFRQNRSISKDALGEFFGGHEALNQGALLHYTDCLDMKSMTVEDALRYYLDHFTLKGEA
jgi:brefeldin A-inhibited guanine nucleotide-exchange protein